MKEVLGRDCKLRIETAEWICSAAPICKVSNIPSGSCLGWHSYTGEDALFGWRADPASCFTLPFPARGKQERLDGDSQTIGHDRS